MNNEKVQYIREHVREVPDFPKKGILFLDVTTIVKDAKAFDLCIKYLTEEFAGEKIDYVAGIESRGFIFGAALAHRLNTGFIPIRKPNKLPAKTIKETYSLEYGTDTIEMHADALLPGDKVLVIDDLLATGGTAVAACNLVKRTGAEVIAAAFIIELNPLKGRQKLEQNNIKTVSLLNYDLD